MKILIFHFIYFYCALHFCMETCLKIDKSQWLMICDDLDVDKHGMSRKPKWCLDFCALFRNCWFSFCCYRSRDEDNMHLVNFFSDKNYRFSFHKKKTFCKKEFCYIFFWRGTVHGGCRIEIDRKRLFSFFCSFLY